MRGSLALLGVIVIAVAATGPAHARQGEHRAPDVGRPTADGQREGIRTLERQLDHAIGRVSLPNAARLLGRDSARGYRLPGYGLVFVLAPRALPSAPGFVYRLRGSGRPFQVGSRREAAGGPELPAEVESVERQVIILQHETEQTRQAAEQDMERIMHDVRIRLAPPERVESPEPVAAAPAPMEPPPAPSAEAQLPPPPPWKFWFESGGPRDERTPEVVVADVRSALVEALANQTVRVPGLLPEESVTVAVDFEPAGLFVAHAGPARTLVVRARVRDLEARARGAIAVEELRRRLEVSEY